MKTTLTTTEAVHRLIDDEYANWSRAGAFALVEYLEELEEDMGNEEIEFCPVSLRCDFSQYSDFEEWAKEQWGEDLACEYWREESGDTEEQDEKTREYIRDRGTLIEFDGGIIVSSF